MFLLSVWKNMIKLDDKDDKIYKLIGKQISILQQSTMDHEKLYAKTGKSQMININR